MKDVEVTGKWWLPWKQNRAVDGTLVFDPVQGGTITLDGSFQGCRLSEYDIVHGFDGKKDITLRKYCERKIIPDLVNGGCQTLAKVGQVFVGRHFETTQDIIFRKLSFGSTHLNEWMRNPPTGQSQTETLDVSYVDLEIDFLNNDDLLRFVFPWTADLRPRQHAQIEITGRSQRHFDHYHWYIVYLQNLLTVAAGKPSFPHNIQGECDGIGNDVAVYLPVPGYDESLISVSHRNMLFTFYDLARATVLNSDEGAETSRTVVRSPHALSRWIEKYNSLWEPAELLVETLYHKSLHPKTTFLFLAQALESIHGSSGYRDNHMDEQEYCRIARDIRKDIRNRLDDKEVLKRLIPEVKRANEFSFADRLGDLCARVGNLADWNIEELLGALQGDCGFITSVKRARNDLSHYPNIPRAKRNEIWIQGLKYNNEMQVLVRFALLLQLGLQTDHIKL